ncbi:MAG: hypothetical protein HQK81_11210 [Desulfovibrionaceae bacterium]|nr:hypothetical protein [Desulfovibrionaceae bacterium]
MARIVPVSSQMATAARAPLDRKNPGRILCSSRPDAAKPIATETTMSALAIAGIAIAAIVLFKVLFPKTGFQG